MTAAEYEFGACTGYAFFGEIEDPAQFLTESGLSSPVAGRYRVSNPRGLRFWMVHFRHVVERTTGTALDNYYELSMAFLVDVLDLATERRCVAWHLPALYLDSEPARRAGVEDFGFPKRRADFRVDENSAGLSVAVVDPASGASLIEFDVDNMALRPADVTEFAVRGVDDKDVNAIFRYDPHCFQRLGSEVVAPQLEADLGVHRMATAATIESRVHPQAAAAFRWRYRLSRFVLQADFNMVLRVGPRIC